MNLCVNLYRLDRRLLTRTSEDQFSGLLTYPPTDGPVRPPALKHSPIFRPAGLPAQRQKLPRSQTYTHAGRLIHLQFRLSANLQIHPPACLLFH